MEPKNEILPELDLASIIESEVEQLKEIVVKARRIHATRDIRAAGNEVENAIRDYLASRIPSNYSVGHGHIVDKNLKVSSQLDIIITEGGKTPFLLKSSDGTRYCPYESVYCIGEVKTSYRKSEKQIHSFSSSLHRIKQGLAREANDSPVEIYNRAISPNLESSLVQIKNGVLAKHTPTNPLFSFMLFLDEGDFKIEDISDLYSVADPRHLPNVVCFLEKGCIAFTGVGKHKITGEVSNVSKYPDFMPSIYRDESNWVYWISAPKGGYLSQLVLDIYDHLQFCLLSEPDLRQYMKKLLFNMEGVSFTK